jgi:hypothetical protein
MESLSFPHQDLANIVNGLVSHAQDPDYGKVDLHITPGASATGILVDRHFQFAEHPNVFDEMMAFTEAGLCDIQAVTSWNAGDDRADRHVRVWAPQQGESKALALELDAESGVRELGGIERDGSKTVTTPIVLGEGSGPEREEASVSDTSLTDGVVIEKIIQPGSGTHHDLLKGIAAIHAAKFHGVSSVPMLRLSPDMTDLVNVGDIFPTLIDLNSPLSINGNYRVIVSELDPDTDILDVQVVEV